MITHDDEGDCLGPVGYPGQDPSVETQDGLRLGQRLEGETGLQGQVLTNEVSVRTRIHQEGS